MTHEETIALVAALPGVVVVTASEAGGAPEVAWGDSFFYAGEQRQRPFAARPRPRAVTAMRTIGSFESTQIHVEAALVWALGRPRPPEPQVRVSPA